MLIGGTIRYEDGVKNTAGDTYSPTRKVAVELNFAIPEDPGIDADSYVNDVLDQAIALVNEKLGIAKPTRAAKVTSVSTDAKASYDAANVQTAENLKAALAENAAARKPRGPNKPKAVDETPLAGAATVVADGAAKPANVTATSSDPMIQHDIDAGTPPPAEKTTDPAAMEEWASEAVTEVTDKDLNDAVHKKNSVLKDPPKIKALIAIFNPDPKKPFTLREIPQAQRQPFLQKLEALA
jgi:hypothetical protein